MERYLIGSKHDTPILGSIMCMCVARKNLCACNTLLDFPSQSVMLATIRYIGCFNVDFDGFLLLGHRPLRHIADIVSVYREGNPECFPL